jgi:hypothetical protein
MGIVYVIAWFNVDRMHTMKIVHAISTAKVTELINNANYAFQLSSYF